MKLALFIYPDASSASSRSQEARPFPTAPDKKNRQVQKRKLTATQYAAQRPSHRSRRKYSCNTRLLRPMH